MPNKQKSTSSVVASQNEAKSEKIPKITRVGRDLSVLLTWLTSEDIQELAEKHGITTTQVKNRLYGRARTKYTFLKDAMDIVRKNREILSELDQLEEEERRVAV